MKRTLYVMVVPTGREPELRTLEADENGSFLRELQGCIGGLIEPMGWLFDDEPAGYCNEEGLLGATFLDANRAVYATKAMEEAGFLSQLDFETPVREGDLYAIVFMVFTGFDPRRGEPRHLPRNERPRALRRRGPTDSAQTNSVRPRGQAPPMKRPERDAAPKTASWHLPLLQVYPPWAQAARDGALVQGPRKTFR
ncbi:MAG: DUF3846 domain-containing protein [Eggerthellaceae bacterium]